MNPKEIAVLLALILPALPAYGDELAVNWWTIDGGGAVGSVGGGGYTLSGTIGQPDAGRPLVGGPYQVQGGFWTGGLLITTDVTEPEPGRGTPSGSAGPAFRARGSAPNPFRAQATVSFDLPSRQPVHLAIYDPSGRLLRTLVDGGLEAGRHDRVWDGRDDEGRTTASGIYFAVLRTPVGQHREKLVKVR